MKWKWLLKIVVLTIVNHNLMDKVTVCLFASNYVVCKKAYVRLFLANVDWVRHGIENGCEKLFNSFKVIS